MIKLLPFLIIMILPVLNSCSTNKPTVLTQDHAPKSIESTEQFSFAPSVHDVEINYKFFKLFYDPEIRLATVVSYKLKATDLRKKNFKRKDTFRVDPKLVEMNLPHVAPKEYLKTGYDKGHLAPAADFSWDKSASDQTFVMTNMAPQLPDLNRKSWKALEERVRRWACGEGEITVITGLLLSSGYASLPSGLPIPQAFFKIIIDETPPRKTLSFIYKQEDRGNLVDKRIVTTEDIKLKTKVSFARYKIPKNEGRTPASLSDWKEADCGQKVKNE